MHNKKSKYWNKNNLPTSLYLSIDLIKQSSPCVTIPQMPILKYYEGENSPLTRALTFGYPSIEIVGYGPTYTECYTGDEHPRQHCYLDHDKELQEWIEKYENESLIPPAPMKLRVDWDECQISLDWREIKMIMCFKENELEAEIYCNSNMPKWLTYTQKNYTDWNVRYLKRHFSGRTPQGYYPNWNQWIPLPIVTKEDHQNWMERYPTIKADFMKEIEEGKHFSRIGRPIETEVW